MGFIIAGITNCPAGVIELEDTHAQFVGFCTYWLSTQQPYQQMIEIILFACTALTGEVFQQGIDNSADDRLTSKSKAANINFRKPILKVH